MYKTIILPVVLYGCETWSLTLMEERRLRVFENRVLRRIVWPKREEVTGKWRRLHNEEFYAILHTKYYSGAERILSSAGHVARMWEKRGAYRVLMDKHEGRRPLGRPRHR
jgi:hypothetical protein